MAQRVNKSVYKVTKEARAAEMRKKIEEEMIAKLSTQFSNGWAQKEAELNNKLVLERATLK